MDNIEFVDRTNKRISEVGSLGANVLKNLQEVKKSVTNILMDKIKTVVPDVSKLPEYSKINATDETDFYKKIQNDISKMTNIISRYTVVDKIYEGEDSFESDIEKAQEKKDSKKKELKLYAAKVIKMFKDIIKENDSIIKDMKESMKEKEDEKKKLETDLKEVMVQLANEKQEISSLNRSAKGIQNHDSAKKIELLEAYISDTKIKIKELSNLILYDKITLNDLEKSQRDYQNKIEKIIIKFENIYKKEANVQIEDIEKEEQKEKKSENGYMPGNVMSPIASGNKITALVKSNDSDNVKAQKMLLDFKNMSEDDRVTLINQYGYEDLLEMSKNLGPFGRTQLRNILNRSIERNDIKIGKEVIKGGKISYRQLEEIVKEINKFNSDIENKTPQEIYDFQSKIEKINIIALFESASTKRITRFVRNFTNKGALINDLNQALKKFSNTRYDRETEILKSSNSFREKLHMSHLNDNRPRVFLDKSKKNPINNERSH